MKSGRKEFASGVVCLFSGPGELAELENDLSAKLRQENYSFALLFFSKNHWNANDICELMRDTASDIPFAACSTAGEITPDGISDGEIMVILFPADIFDIQPFEITREDTNNMQDVVSKVHAMKSAFFSETDESNPSYNFVICLMDGMSYMEEAITAALHWGLDDIPLLGGSAGDSLDFNETSLVLNGEILEGNAIILQIKSRLPVEVFKTENFVPTSKKLIVTESEPDKRIVHEFNGAPAAITYAEIIGTDPESLTPQSFASHPLVVRVGGEYYCRSIQKVNDDGSLTFFCAIDDGIVLTVAEPTGMARTTDSKMQDLKESLGDIDFVLGFDCVLRQIDARNRQVTHRISKIYEENNIIGFNTYGEQYQSMHLNQTLTGVAFGKSTTQELKNVS